MRRMIELAYLGIAVLLLLSPLGDSSGSDEGHPDFEHGAAVARVAIESYSSLLSRVASEAADALDAGQVTSDRELQEFIEGRRQAAADAAFERLHQHQQHRIGVESGAAFDPKLAAKVMREYAQGWKR